MTFLDSAGADASTTPSPPVCTSYMTGGNVLAYNPPRKHTIEGGRSWWEFCGGRLRGGSDLCRDDEDALIDLSVTTSQCAMANE
ncbi:unnamed protein product [Mesocestoides corti]|uniref:Uncharacterized protein n=1 Tax=Mesocestoides corti TaxID=53468 RepID=A0A0R3UAK8_MESCO|nr:unnamed protein product [Mesocestoides corti]